MPEFYMIFARKINQKARILDDFCPINIFPNLPPSSPTPMYWNYWNLYMNTNNIQIIL